MHWRGVANGSIISHLRHLQNDFHVVFPLDFPWSTFLFQLLAWRLLNKLNATIPSIDGSMQHSVATGWISHMKIINFLVACREHHRKVEDKLRSQFHEFRIDLYTLNCLITWNFRLEFIDKFLHIYECFVSTAYQILSFRSSILV